MVKKKLKGLRGLWKYKFDQPFQIVYVLSCMRSGSSLLKSLLQSNLELDYHKEINVYNNGDRFYTYGVLADNQTNGWVIAKKPSSFRDFNSYPNLHLFGREKFIVLFRDPNEIFHSVRNMREDVNKPLSDEAIIDYIQKTTQNLIEFVDANVDQTFVTYYDNLVNNPELELKRIMEFLGNGSDSVKTTYAKELNREGWGFDDPSEKFNSGKIVKEKKQLAIEVPDQMLSDYHRIREKYGFQS